LCAKVAATSQAALALNLPDGQCRRPHPALEVADAQLHHRVPAMILVQPHSGADPVTKGVVAPVGEQLRLLTH